MAKIHVNFEKVLLRTSDQRINKKKLSTTHSTDSVYAAVQLEKKMNKIEPRTSKSLGSLIRECTFWKNCNQLLWLLLCTTTKSAGDTFGFLWQPEVKKAKGKKNSFILRRIFDTFSTQK